ncbi:restriction endonuclease subunit S [Enterococcus faecalis]|uniref:restriction endonuclease subunit S n=2 Tax=Enterococcus faecalis TaxID=1351 RepID=UPI000CF2F8B0|nr:restriction endonuclease subunit S [Enterococcus faecalis]EJX7955782.1 restriction endonuclease subunit S [Enterococcus faecalis]PQD42346.1 restriction endonuclease subunit S [Enterococcus faecalis]
MRDEMKKVPRLRFRGFQEDWELCKFEKLTDFFSGLTYSPDNVQKDGTFVLRSSNVKDNAIVSADNVYVRNEVANSEHVQVGDVIVVVRNGSRSLIGKHAPINREMPNTVIGAFMTGLRSPSPKFLKALLDTQQFNVEIHKNLGATINQITTGEFKRMHFTVPIDEDEKEKIGSLFRQLDDIIALHQRKLDQLKELKKAYLQVMFPVKDERVPKLRLADFEGEWEQCKLGDITKISTGKLDANAMVENGKYDFYTSGIKKYRIDVPAFEGPAITIAGNGATVGYMHLADNKFNAYQRTYVLQEFVVDRSFLFSEVGNKLPKKINQEARTGNIPYIVMDMLTELKLSIPQDEAEQSKIGSFFKQIDKTIALHQNKLEQLKDLKTSYLQNMFI